MMGHIRKGHVSVNVNTDDVGDNKYYDALSGDDVHEFGFTQVGGRGAVLSVPPVNEAVPDQSE